MTAILKKEKILYVGWCPELNIASQGKSIDETIANLREALELYLEDEDAYIPEELTECPQESPMLLCLNVESPKEA